jgi:hypothetical protein
MSERERAILPATYANLKTAYQSVLKRETREHQEHDEPLGMTARSVGH